MTEVSTFRGTQELLLGELGGEHAAELLDENAALSVMEFLDAHGASIEPLGIESDSLEVRLGGPVFISVRRFVWGSASAILGLAVAILTSDPKMLASGAQLVGSLLSSVSRLPTRHDRVQGLLCGRGAAEGRSTRQCERKSGGVAA